MKPNFAKRWTRWVPFVLTLVFVFAVASIATAGLIREGNGKAAPFAAYTEKPYAPYTAGPVVREVPFAAFTEVPYAPYTAGPVVREVPFAAYTEKAYAPYTAGPVVPEVKRSGKMPLK